MAQVDSILSKVDDEEVKQVTRDLVAIPSITHHEGMGVVNYLEKWFEDLDIPMRIIPYDDRQGEEPRANFFADFGAADGPGRYMFNGHQDIKPVDGMTIDPYGGEIKDGKMYGRGTCDMKGGIAAVLCAMKACVRDGFTPKGGITFFSDIEEEFGGGGGYLWAKREGLYDGYEGLVSCEPTELEVQIGNRGVFAVSFETKGRSAHSGLAHLGVNAVQHMVMFITEFLKLPYLQVENEYFGKCTCNWEYIRGGLYLSAVPDKCQACVDSRLIPDTPPEVVQEQVDSLIARLKKEHGVDIREVEQPEGWRPASPKQKAESIPADHPFTQRVVSAYKQGLGKDPDITGCPAITIAMEVIEIGIPAIICGPGSISKAHTEDEYVPVQDLLDSTRIYAALMAEM